MGRFRRLGSRSIEDVVTTAAERSGGGSGVKRRRQVRLFRAGCGDRLRGFLVTPTATSTTASPAAALGFLVLGASRDLGIKSFRRCRGLSDGFAHRPGFQKLGNGAIGVLAIGIVGRDFAIGRCAGIDRAVLATATPSPAAPLAPASLGFLGRLGGRGLTLSLGLSLSGFVGALVHGLNRLDDIVFLDLRLHFRGGRRVLPGILLDHRRTFARQLRADALDADVRRVQRLVAGEHHMHAIARLDAL